MILYHYVPIVARVRRRVEVSNHVWRVRWLDTAIEIVKLHIARNIKRHVRNGPWNCTMRNYSNSLRQLKIVRFACYHYLHFIWGQSTKHVVGKLFAVDVFMRLKNEMVVWDFVPFAELQLLLQMK